MFERFNGNVVPFADESTSTNRTVFGSETQSDDIDDNLNADFKKGWEIVGLNDNPTREDFNAMGYTLGYLTSYLYQNGVAEYSSLQEYKTNSIAIGADGNIYQSLVDNNLGNALTDTTKWVCIASKNSIVNSIAELKTISNIESTNVLGYYEKGDGGGGTFYWDATSTETDNGGTIIQATGITTGRWKRVFSGAVNVKWFGAKGDGVADDSQSIRLALSTSGTILFPQGTYLIKTWITSSYANWKCIAELKSNTTLLGENGAIIKQDNGINQSINTPQGLIYFITDNTKNIEINNITFDFNGINNIKTDHNSKNSALFVGTSENVIIRNCFFLNSSGRQILSLGQEPNNKSKNILVENNLFYNFGVNIDALRDDFSAIYCCADGLVVINNIVDGGGTETIVTTFVDCPSSTRVSIQENDVRTVQQLAICNTVGLTNTNIFEVKNNIFNNGKYLVNILDEGNAQIDSLIIKDNIMKSGSSDSCIAVWGGSFLAQNVVTSINISGNTYDNTYNATQDNSAISLSLSIPSITIENNIISGTTGNPITIGSQNVSNIVIKNNILSDCRKNIISTVSNGLITIYANNTITVECSNNYEKGTNGSVCNFLTFTNTNGTGNVARLDFVDNYILSTIYPYKFLTSVLNSSSVFVKGNYYVTGRDIANDGWGRPVIGSEIINKADNTIWFQSRTTQNYWNRKTFGTAVPTANFWSQGDIAYNTSPSASGYIGWVCVVNGTPGTWKGFGLIQS